MKNKTKTMGMQKIENKNYERKIVRILLFILFSTAVLMFMLSIFFVKINGMNIYQIGKIYQYNINEAKCNSIGANFTGRTESHIFEGNYIVCSNGALMWS